MVDLDDDIHTGIQLLVRDAPEPVEWEVVTRRHHLRRRRRTLLIGATAIAVVLLLIAGVARVSSDDPTVTTNDGTALPCRAWIAVHTLFDSSANSKGNLPSPYVGAVSAEQAAFLVRIGDVPDRVAQELGGSPNELAAHVVVRANPSLATVEITAWGLDAPEARKLADAFSESLLASVQDIQQRELDRQRDALDAAISQLQLELTGVAGDDPDAAASRERLGAELTDKKVQLQGLDEAAAQGSNIYSFGSSEAFQVSGSQLNTLLDESSESFPEALSPVPRLAAPSDC